MGWNEDQAKALAAVQSLNEDLGTGVRQYLIEHQASVQVYTDINAVATKMFKDHTLNREVLLNMLLDM